jgi:hypothetical protein
MRAIKTIVREQASGSIPYYLYVYITAFSRKTAVG